MRVAYRQRRRLDGSTNWPLHIDLRKAVTQSIFGFGRREMIADPSWTGFRRVIIMHHLAKLPGPSFAALSHRQATDLMVKNGYFEAPVASFNRRSISG